MKKVLILLTMLVVSLTSYAQWTTNGTSIYSSNTGNVGIGTTTPAYKLDVNGTLNVSGTLMTSGGYYIGTSPAFVTGANSSTLFMPTKKLLLGSGPTSNAIGMLSIQINSSNSNYGSITSSETGIYLQNSVGTSGNFNLISFGDNTGTDIAQLGSITASHTNHTGKIFFATRTSGGALTQRLLIDENGMVGIGTNTPSAKLHVNGGAPGGNISFYVNGGARIGGAASIGRSGTHYDEFGYNVDFTTTNDQYKYLAGDAAASIRMGWNGDIEFRTAPTGAAGATLSLNTRMRLKENGNLGIGTTTPAYRLDVNGTANATALRAASLQIIGGSPAAGKVLTSDASGNASWQSVSGLSSQWTTSGSNIYYNTAGLVSIGTATAPAGYKLAVAGKIVAEEVVVKLQSNWPDYVFEKDYALLPLYEVEKYIQSNKHLPEVPSAKDVKENGVELAAMEALLLKKVEELTIYLIDANKRIDALQTELENLKSKK